MKIYLDFLDIILGSALMLQLMSLGLVDMQHGLKHSKWLIFATVVTVISLFITMVANPMLQSAFAGAMFTGSLVVFLTVIRGEHQ